MLATVLRHRFRRLVREDWPQWLQKLGLILMGGYFAVGALVAGAFFPHVVERAWPESDPAALLDAYLFAGLLGLTVVRFFFQPSPYTDVRPYLHLPIRRGRLARVVLGLSVFGLMNGLAFCFLVPVWISTVLPSSGLGGALAWELGASVLVLVTHYLVLPLRILSARHGARFWAVASFVAVLVALDEAAGPGVLPGASAWFFGELAGGGVGCLLLLGPLAALGGVFDGSARLLLSALRAETYRSSRRWWGVGAGAFGRLTHAGPSAAVVALELRLILRNNRALISTVMGVLAIPYVLTITEDGELGIFRGLIGVFASGGFALLYGQSIFSWSGAHLDGLLTCTPSLRTLVQARLSLLQASCLTLYLVGLPLLAWLRPSLLPIHAAFLLFNVGVVCPLVVLTALFATTAVDLSASAFSSQGNGNWTQMPFGLLVFTLALAVGWPPAPWHLWLASGLGLAGLAATPLWNRALARVLAWRRYRMLSSFRAS